MLYATRITPNGSRGKKILTKLRAMVFIERLFLVLLSVVVLTLVFLTAFRLGKIIQTRIKKISDFIPFVK